jgi:acyl-CoA synthetase (AMP-forming)/AMP-acid ligase II
VRRQTGRGEVLVAGSRIMKGYWRKPDQTAERRQTGRGEGPNGLAFDQTDSVSPAG